MKRTVLMAGVVLLAGLFLAQAAAASGHGPVQPQKEGILLVAFGTSEPSAEVSFTNIEKKVRAAHPDADVRWAYTSHIIRKKLAGQGKHIDSVAEALAAMMDDGVTHVTVQSLHTIPGQEFHELLETAGAFANLPGGFASLRVGMPLLATQDDVAKAVDAILATIPAQRKSDEAVVLMGHGTHHPANAYYSAVNWQLAQRDDRVIMGTVEGYPELDDLVGLLKEKKVRTVWLMPFMSVAGDHAKNDMAGPEPDSWKSQLTQKGFDVNVVLKGTAEYDDFVALWVDHIDAPAGH